MGFLSSLFGGSKKPKADPFGRVEITQEAVIYHRPDRIEEIKLADLIEVGILTTDEGPFSEDVFFMLLGPTNDKGVAIPQGAAGNEELLIRLQELPGFDNSALIEAMGCTSNNRFMCWKKEA